MENKVKIFGQEVELKRVNVIVGHADGAIWAFRDVAFYALHAQSFKAADMHPNDMRGFWDTLFAASLRDFVLLPTNNIELIGAGHKIAKEEYDYDFQVIRLDWKDAERHYRVVVYDHEVLQTALDSNIEFR